MKLSTLIKVGQKIKTSKGWEKVIEVTIDGARTKDSFVKFGDEVSGWKAT
jgi:hypothetical protein